MCRKLTTLILIVLLGSISFAQTVEPKKPADDREKLKKEAVAFLRETMADVNNMRSLENRISFSSEMAGLMWFHDAKEAKTMFGLVVNDFKELLMQYDRQMDDLGIKPGGEEDIHYGGMFSGDVTDRAQISRKFRTAMAVRQQIAMSIAEHDAELAFTFYYDSLRVISNAEFRKQIEGADAHFEQQLIAQIAESNAAKAVQFASKTLENGVNYQHIDLLKKIHAKDAEKGAEFATALLSRLKTEKVDSSDLYIMNSFLSFGSQTYRESILPGGKKGVLTMQELRELSNIFARAILDHDSEDIVTNLAYADDIERYSPSRAAQIRAKYRNRNPNPSSNSANAAVANAMNAAANAAKAAANAVSMAANSNSNSMSDRNSEREERQKAEEKLMSDVMNLADEQLPKEEREKVIAQARKILLQSPAKEKKITGLSMLAAQVAKAGDKELAAEIMRDAHGLVNPNPKNYQDFLLTWMLATGYASADPDKAFPLLEETIGRANETISAFVKVGEFIDVAEEMIQDGEVQVGAFGGQMIRGLTKELGVADATIQLLANTNFAKTKALTNRFERPEVRILAKMMVLRAVLGGKPAIKSEDAEVSTEK